MLAKNIIVDYRAKEGLTQKEMAKKIGISRVTLVAIEQGGQLSTLTRGKIAKFFCIDVGEIE